MNADAPEGSSPFKICPLCRQRWQDRDEFISDPHVVLVGYQPIFINLKAGLFLFQHDTPDCQTSMGIEAERFLDMHNGEIFEGRMEDDPACPGHCMKEDSLEPCPLKCECAYVRNVLQTIQTWPKRDASRV